MFSVCMGHQTYFSLDKIPVAQPQLLNQVILSLCPQKNTPFKEHLLLLQWSGNHRRLPAQCGDPVRKGGQVHENREVLEEDST